MTHGCRFRRHDSEQVFELPAKGILRVGFPVVLRGEKLILKDDPNRQMLDAKSFPILQMIAAFQAHAMSLPPIGLTNPRGMSLPL